MRVANARVRPDLAACRSVVEGLERLEIVLNGVRRGLSGSAKQYGVNLHCAFILRRATAESGVTIRELVAELAISQSRVSQLIDDLREQDLIIDERDPRRRRFKLIRATEKGRYFLLKRDGALSQLMAEMLSNRQIEDHAATIDTALSDAVSGFFPRNLFSEPRGLATNSEINEDGIGDK